MTTQGVTTDTYKIYKAAQEFGSLNAIYQAAAKHPARPDDRADLARQILAALAAEHAGEAHAFGSAAVVLAALAGEPYATYRIDAVTTAVIL